MAGMMMKEPGVFEVTPHKVSICVLLQLYAPPAQISVPFPFCSVSQHNLLGLYLLSLTKCCNNLFEPKLEELMSQLKQVGGSIDQWLIDHLANRLSCLSSPDDLFNLFGDVRGILGGPDVGVLEDDQVILDPSSSLGMFVRRCVLAFNLLSFEGVCHLLTSIENYCNDVLASRSSYDLPHLDDSSNDLEASMESENMDLETFVYKKVTEEAEANKKACETVSFHLHAPKSIFGLIEDTKVSTSPKDSTSGKSREASTVVTMSSDSLGDLEGDSPAFLRTHWQVQGYLAEQADAIEKDGNSFSLNAFELILSQLQKLAPELHRVHFLRYLSNLYRDDYFAALDSLNCYFDYSAGTEGFDLIPPPGSFNNFGRYEIGLLCLGMMQFHFGHPNQALEVLTEAVRVCQQQSNDTCLAYTLAAICNLLSEIGIASTNRILGSSYSPVSSVCTSLSVQQQLNVLLRGSLKRAESLKLKRLVASNHLAMAKFELTHVQRPLLSFGPRASIKLKTRPLDVCKELRLGSHLISEFLSESSAVIIDGAISTAWLTNLQNQADPQVLSQENGSGNSSNIFQFCAQRNSVPGSVLQLVGSSYLLRSTAWEIYGSTPLARTNVLVYTACFADASSSSDAALAHVKLIQHLALHKGYKDAFAALKIAEEKFLSVSKSRVSLLKLQLLHEQALHRGNLKLAQRTCDELGGLASPVTGVDMEVKVEAGLRRARTLLAAKQFSQAAAVAHSLFCMCYKFNLQVENASILLLLAEIHKKSGNAVLGLPYALASLSFCQSFNLDLLKASATLTLAELWLALGPNHAKRALELVHRAFPMILGHGGLELCARAYISEAKCYLSDPNFSVSDNAEVVLDSLQQASDELQALEYHELAAEAFYLMAIVFDKLDLWEEREEAAASFKKHITALEEQTRDADDFLFQ